LLARGPARFDMNAIRAATLPWRKSVVEQLLDTGIPLLNLLLGGGIPQRHLVIVTGDPGTGKTVLCSQIAFAQAKMQRNVVVATLASEAQDKLIAELRGFSFFDPDCIGEELFLVSAYPWVQRGPKEAKELLLRTMKERKASMLFIDGLRSIRDLWQNEAKLRDFLYELNVGLSQYNAVGLITTEYPLRKLMDYPEATTVDGLISLSALRFGGRIVRRIQVAKLRGRGHLTGEHVMHIGADGISIVPRLEETTNVDATFVPSQARAEFGLADLDGVLHGGLPVMSTTLLAGSTGVGKTLLGAHFVATGARHGQRGMLVSYSEPVSRLAARAKGIALDLGPLVRDGSLLLEYHAPINSEADDLVTSILDQVKRHRVERLVVDGIGEIEQGTLEQERVRGLLSSLMIQLRQLGVTTIFIKEVPKITGPELDFSDTPISVTAENVLFLRHIELDGELRRILSVLKMRESGYDPHVHEFVISQKGLRVLGPIVGVDGLLTGTGRQRGTSGPNAGANS
jgi:circadian clock protein KaiC